MGAWKDDIFLRGKGILISSTGKYCGSLVHMLKDGEGTFELVNGDVMKGKWMHDHL